MEEFAIKSTHSKTRLRYHLIFVTKYRVSFLHKIDASVLNAFRYAEQKLKIKILHIKSDKNHIHLLISSHPSLSVSHIAKVLKQVSLNQLWKLEPDFMKKIYWHKEKLLWARGYFASTIGNIVEDKIAAYIEDQGL